ncbi:MAG: DNA-directed RNA polymerase I subunit rpa49 [Piccolia ochrophora]|nr:MAG: DNA-directed RNA polymerase I subunit rpa49 [Piccolia ochrophora]
MEDRKRKAKSHDDGRAPKKAVSSSGLDAQTVRISDVLESEKWGPVLASTPGLSIPHSALFDVHIAPKSKRIPRRTSDELLLHSSTHAKTNYVAREFDKGILQPALRHYVGVFDSATGHLQVINARDMVLQATLLEEEQEAKEKDVEETVGETLSLLPLLKCLWNVKNKSQRNELGREFGTKKMRKAIASQTENAITPRRTDVEQARGISLSSPKDPVATVLLKSMEDASSMTATREELQAASDESKPRPRANLDATKVEDVYPLESLVSSEEMRALMVKEWQDAAKAEEPITTKSLFVSNRVQRIGSKDDVRMLKVLRYYLLLLEFYQAMATKTKKEHKISKRDELRKALGVQDFLIEGLMRTFTKTGAFNKWCKDKLLIHIAALALLLDDFVLDIHDVKVDLKLETRQ